MVLVCPGQLWGGLQLRQQQDQSTGKLSVGPFTPQPAPTTPKGKTPERRWPPTTNFVNSNRYYEKSRFLAVTSSVRKKEKEGIEKGANLSFSVIPFGSRDELASEAPAGNNS